MMGFRLVCKVLAILFVPSLVFAGSNNINLDSNFDEINNDSKNYGFPDSLGKLGFKLIEIEESIKMYYSSKGEFANQYEIDKIFKINYEVISERQLIAHTRYSYRNLRTDKVECCDERAFSVYKINGITETLMMSPHKKGRMDVDFEDFNKSLNINGTWYGQYGEDYYILSFYKGKASLNRPDGSFPFWVREDSIYKNDVLENNGKYLVDIQGSLYYMYRGNPMIRNGRMTDVLYCRACQNISMPTIWWYKSSNIEESYFSD